MEQSLFCFTLIFLVFLFLSDGQIINLEESDYAPEYSSTTFKTREVCTLKCDVACSNCSAILQDGQQIEMFHCKKSRTDQGRPLLIVIIENPCLFAFILLIILVITGAIIASSVLLHRMLPSHWFEIE